MKRSTWALLILPAAFLLWAGNGFPYLPGAAFSDFAISHYPNALYLQRALTTWHTFPWWSPLILSGAPFAADPLSSVWYPPHYLALLFPLPFGLNLVAALHLFIGGLGIYRLLRGEDLREETALFGALAFQLLPKLWAHYAAGHLTLWYAVMWTPWVVCGQGTTDGGRWTTDDGQQTAVSRAPHITPFSAVLLAFLADPRWGAFAGVLWGSRVMYQVSGARYRVSGTTYRLSRVAMVALLAAALPYGLFLLQFARLSTRAALTAADALTLSLPLTRLFGLLLPLGGSQEYVLYPTAAALALALLAGRRARFWQVTAGLALAYALGNALPFFAPLLVRLPGLNLLRVPSRALFLFGMALIVLAAHGLDALLRGEAPPGRIRAASLGVTALAAAAVLLTLGAGALTGQWEAATLWNAALWTAVALGLGFALRGRWPPQTAFVFLLGALLLDGGGFVLRQVTFRPAAEALQEQDALAAYLADQPGRFRVYSPSYSLPQQTAAFYGLELADGVNPLQISGYAQFMAQASGVPTTGYSVTLPPFANGDPAHDNAAYTPDACLLGLFNVRFVAAEFDLHAPHLEEMRRFGETRLYRNACAIAPAWVQPADAPPGEEAVPLPDEAVRWTPNRVTVQADGPGLLVLSEVAYPGWQARVDGVPAPLLTPAGVLRGVLLPAGAHTVIFSYAPLLAMRNFLLP
ncbi:MAG: hypothetical protein Fur0018_16400 [Anaerolineales bacterium]